MSGLAALDRVREGRAKKVKPPWVRPPFTPGADAPWVIAFDPSLASTGWAVMTAQHPFVHEVGTLITKPRDGEEGNLVRGVAIYEQSLELLHRLSHQWRAPERAPSSWPTSLPRRAVRLCIDPTRSAAPLWPSASPPRPLGCPR